MAKKLHIKKKWFRIIPFIALFVIYLCSELYFIKNYVTKGGKSNGEIYDNPDETINIYDLRYTKRMVSDKSKAEKKDDLYEYYSISFKLCTESNNPPEIKKISN